MLGATLWLFSVLVNRENPGGTKGIAIERESKYLAGKKRAREAVIIKQSLNNYR